MNDEDLTGKQLGEYRLESMLGQGGMARVYRATDVRLKRRAVIKVIDPPSRNDPGYMTRFEREAQIIGQLDHPNIVRLYRYDEQDGWLYMAMQHIEGADLGVVLANYKADNAYIEPDDARRILREITAALDYAHRKGVIHRDVKPANILLDRQGRAFLSDFGLALITDIGTRGEIFGSAHYMAPEQAVSSAKAVPQSDLYALGVILYEMFTGEVPFHAERPLDIAFLQITEAPTPPSQLRPDIPPQVEAVILKSLSKKPEDRYQTGAELADALDAALDARPVPDLPAAARQSILERVALELDDTPLPLPPAALALSNPVEESSLNPPLPPVPAVVASVNHPATLERATPNAPINKKPWLYAGLAAGVGVIALLALGCLGLFALPSILNGFRTGTTTSPTMASSLPVLGATATTAPLPQKTGAPALATETVVVPQQETTTPKQPVTYTLLIVRGPSNDSLFIINQSGRPFPLGLLRLGNDNNSVSGEEWRLANLKNTGCVGIWKETKGNNKNKLPDEVTCTLLGVPVVKEKKGWFGESQFNVYYAEKQFGVCAKDQKECPIKITVP